MNWGEQNSEVDAHSQLALTIDCAVNLVDTAEIYIPWR